MVKVTAIGFVNYNAKVLDINDSGTGTKSCTLAAYVPPNTVAITIAVACIGSGTGYVKVYPNSGSQGWTLTSDVPVTFQIAYPNIKYNQTVGNDDFDLWLLGYWVEGRLKTR